MRGGGGSGSLKGTRFKSSPLGGGERGGVVVAERVKEMGDEGRGGGGEEGRIPDGKDKAGPDKGGDQDVKKAEGGGDAM